MVSCVQQGDGVSSFLHSDLVSPVQQGGLVSSFQHGDMVTSAQLAVDVNVVVSWVFLTSLVHVLDVCQPVFHRDI